MNRLTFKKQPRETGLWSVGHPYQDVDIKCDGKVVGRIAAPYWNSEPYGWKIGLTVKKDNIDIDGNRNWMWVFFKPLFKDENDARQWVKDNWVAILEKYTLHSHDD